MGDCLIQKANEIIKTLYKQAHTHFSHTSQTLGYRWLILIYLMLPLYKKNTILNPGKIKLGSVEVVYLKQT